MKKIIKYGIIAFAALLIIGSIGSCIGNVNTNSSTILEDDSCDIDTTEIVEQHKKEYKYWECTTEKDDMDDSMSYWHSLSSDNYANFDFPYEGDSYLTITARYMKKYGYDVLVSISKGQMVGSEYNGTNYIRVRFDGGKAQKWYYNEPSDGSSTEVFLQNPQKFIKKLQNAKDIIIEQQFYQEGVHQFKFHVDKPLVSNIRSVPQY